MVNWLKLNWFKISALILVLLISGVSLYWFGVRPKAERRDCYEQAYKQRQNAIQLENNIIDKTGMTVTRADYNKVFNDAYNDCLLEKGLKQ